MITKTFSTLLPPPNITGSLHIGHYFNWTLQDFLIQYKKQKGYNINWHIGVDHAGIATQYIVERELQKQGLNRLDLGREKFHEKILEWNLYAQKLIEEQVHNFDFPEMHWEKHRFTMDQEYQKQVIKAFIQLHKDGLIHKKLRITNWDIKFQSAISDLEVIEKVEKSKIYIIEYKSATNDESLFVATTRPETIFADTALCLNINDKRRKKLEGKEFLIPLINRKIPVIFDELCLIEKGLGVLKVTPAHDALDYEIGEKHNLPIISIISKEGRLYNTIKELDGLLIEEAKKKILEIFDKNNINYEEKEWEGIKKYTEKSNIPVETILTEQWFLDVQEMAKTALKYSQNIEFYPEYLRHTFEYWMNNIKPWCISRQIWWGHQIPIWYTKDNQTICAETKEEAEKIAKTSEITQDTDVLDTWFSSALWPKLSNETTDILITGKDILFFWVARMIMFSLYFDKKIPFKAIYFNGIVRDANNSKMSKTKGNVINPLDINNQYGQDVLRLTLLRNTGNNKDIKLRTQDLELSRNFITKMNNSYTFITQFMGKDENSHQDLNNWIESTIKKYNYKIEEYIEQYEFQKATETFHDLFWNYFCNWYIEGLKKYPTNKALTYFNQIMYIGIPFLPKTTQKYLTFDLETIKNNIKIDQNNVNSKNFEKIIKLTKLLRSMKKIVNLNEIKIDFETLLITHLTKLKINNTLTFQIIYEGITIYLEQKYLLLFKDTLKKDIEKLEKEIDLIILKITKSNNVPENIIEEWENNLIMKKKELIQIKTLIENLKS